MTVLKILVLYWQIVFHDGCQIYISFSNFHMPFYCTFISSEEMDDSWVLRPLSKDFLVLFSDVYAAATM